MRSVEWNPRKKREERIVGGSFDKDGVVVEDQQHIPTDIVSPLGSLCNLLNPASQKSDAEQKKYTSKDRERLIEVHLGQLRRAITYWTGDEAIASKLDVTTIQQALEHISEGGRRYRLFAQLLIRRTNLPRSEQEDAISALSHDKKFKSLFEAIPTASPSKAKTEIQSEIADQARQMVEELVSKKSGSDPSKAWRGEPPPKFQIGRYFEDAQKQETGLAGVANRVLYKIGADQALRTQIGDAYKMPSDALVNPLRAAQRFYLEVRPPGVFFADTPFRESSNGPVRSSGFSASKLVLALSPEYDEILPEKMDLGHRIDAFKSDLAASIEAIALRLKTPLDTAQRRVLVSILGSLDEKMARKIYKEALKAAKKQKSESSKSFEEVRTESKQGNIPQLPSEPLAPDDFARLQAVFSNMLISELRDPHMTLGEFITAVTKERVKELRMTGAWRDRGVSEVVHSLEEGADLGRERARVEQFINNLPYIARLATEKRSEEIPGRKHAVRLAAQALYEMAQEIREKRLRDARTTEEDERASTAKETSRQQEEFARTYRMFVEYGLIQTAPEPLEFPEQADGQSDEEYAKLTTDLAVDHEKAAQKADADFRAARKDSLYKHISDFLEHLDDDAQLRGNMVARIGEIIGKKGKDLKKVVREKIREIDARPPAERFTVREKGPMWEWSQWDPYVIYDQETGRLLQPPEQMRESIKKAEELNTAAREAVRIAIEKLDMLYHKAGSTMNIAEIDANQLDVIEHEFKDLFMVLVQSQNALKRFGKNRSSFAYKSAQTTIDRLGGPIAGILSMRDRFDVIRRELLRKFIMQVRQSMKEVDDPRAKKLDQLLAEYELTSRTGSATQVKEAINFFLYTE